MALDFRARRRLHGIRKTVHKLFSEDAHRHFTAASLIPNNKKERTSQNEEVATNANVLLLKKKMSAEEMAIYILEYCSTWRSVDEIAKFADRDKDYIRNKVLPKLTEKLEKEFPDVPNHPKQKYRTKKRKEM